MNNCIEKLVKIVSITVNTTAMINKYNNCKILQLKLFQQVGASNTSLTSLIFWR